MVRNLWGTLTDSQLLAQCEVDTYRASGPGGQKRNKTSSAVRIRHLPSGLLVIAEESRSQHENKAKALKRLRQAFYLKIREPLLPEQMTQEALEQRPEYNGIRDREGRLSLSRKDPRYWPLAGLVLDLLQAVEAKVSEAASLLGISTGHLIDFLQGDDKIWEQANYLRKGFGLGLLR